MKGILAAIAPPQPSTPGRSPRPLQLPQPGGKELEPVDIKIILPALTVVFTLACLFFGTKNGFYDSDDYHGNGSAH
ncbi:MAG: hypothetical protein MH825_09335 [Cyanobacteria bacterium]|nr:hypothetical protein [Cyanobacteriota bacterium]